ncbi:MAG: undecaprenyl-diphosphate phosphatase [Kiloniellales bacterium]
MLHVFILAVVQGITEFLPISSSAHIDITFALFDAAGWQVPAQTQGERLSMNVAVHVGTLVAVCVYYWRDLLQMLLGAFKLLTGEVTPGGRLFGYLFVGSLPLAVIGYFFHDVFERLHTVEVIAWTSIGFGVLLYFFDRIGLTVRRLEHLKVSDAAIIGLAQVLAFIPGTSRAGITMTAARFLGFERAEAAHFSLLLSIPGILGAGLLEGLDLWQSGNVAVGFDAILGAAIACVVALLAIALMMRWLRHASFTPFVVYRILLGFALLYWMA